MVDYLFALKRPFQNWTTLVIGVIIGILGAMTFGIIGLFLSGFGVVCAKEIFANKTALPQWKNWIELFVKGILALIITIIYFIPAIIFFALGALAVLSTILQSGIALASMDFSQITPLIGQLLLVGGPLFFIGIILAILAALALPMGLSFFAKEDFGSAFHIKRIVKKCFTAKYIVSLIVTVIFAIIYGIVALIIMAIFFLFPQAGSLIASGVVTYLMTVSFYTIFSQTLKELG